MIYLTGDLHGDKGRFKAKGLRRLKKGDTLVVCGDFGFLWDGSKGEKRLLAQIGRLRYNVLFVEGTHDNLALVNQYPTEEWNGGLTHAISGNLRHLVRGEQFVLEGVSILALGGGHPPDDLRPGESLLHSTMPTNQEILEICRRLEERGGPVDVIVSHQAPTNIDGCITHRLCDVSLLTALLDTVQQRVKFRLWCFGSYHQNRPVPPTYRALYDEVYCAGGTAKKPFLQQINKT